MSSHVRVTAILCVWGGGIVALVFSHEALVDAGADAHGILRPQPVSDQDGRGEESGACCDTATGECREITTPDTCDANEEFLGFGTDCNPNCCEAPAYTGGDSCLSATHPLLLVPALGDPPVTVTISGNNSGATFNEFNLICSWPWPEYGDVITGPACTIDDDCGSLCLGGKNPFSGLACGVDADCPDPFDGACQPGACGPICDQAIFDPQGETQDPGWWESFHIMDCAFLRVDLCCTSVNGEPWRPAWGNLVEGCPCQQWISTTSPSLCPGCFPGSPLTCEDDNLYLYFGPLPVGHYYYPVYSAPDGTGASPPGATYQMHVTVAACPIAACCVGSSCAVVNELVCQELDGYWHRGVVDCSTLCLTGSCCTDPGRCEDETPTGEAMTEADCTTLGGYYVGGALCDSDPLPCPICDMESEANCQLPDLNLEVSTYMMMMNDRSLPLGGVVLADDFIPTQDTITTVCTWGAYLDAVEIEAVGGNGRGDDCNDDVVDDFRVTVYPDDNGKPDDKNPIGESDVVIIAKGPVDSVYGSTTLYDDAQVYSYQMTLVSPITGMTPGVKHWIEITNNTVFDADGGACMWHQALTSNERNDFHYVGTDREAKNPAYQYGGGRAGASGDVAFCIDQPFTAPLTVLGLCCDCDSATCEVTTLVDCSGIWDQTGVCAGACSTVVPGDICVVNPIVTSDPNFTYTYDSRCTDTDGPPEELSDLGIVPMGSDIWVHYIAPCSGQVQVHMCGTGNIDNAYDTVLAVYKDNTDPLHCACPGDPGFQRLGLAQDESCNGVADGGAGYLRPAPIVAVGHCLTVRAAGYDAKVGTGTLKIACEFHTHQGEQPFADPRVPDAGFGTRNRYLSFTSGSSGLIEAMRVTFASLPPPHDQFNGDRWFVGEPFEVTESPCCNDPTPPPTFWAATLQCGAPFYTDWSDYGVVHVYDAGIVAGASYRIQATTVICTPWDEDCYSAALTINTSALGDVVGNCDVHPCTPPQGVVDFIDIFAVAGKFASPPPPPIQKSRTDLVATGISVPPPDQKIDFVDVSVVVDAFRGSPRTLPGPQAHCP